MENLRRSSLKFFSDQQLCYADILTPSEVRARIEVAVLNFLRILTSPDPAISDLPLNRILMIFFVRAIDVVALLRCSRYSLGIMASSRGVVAGRLLLQEPNQEVVDCAECGSSGYAISGDLNMLDKLLMKTDARYIIVVEKHAIFQRLAEDRVFNHIPSILITAKGYPDIATRFFLHRMSRTFPELPILALVDWNPAGLAILCTFKFGSIGMGLEAYRYGAFLPVSFQILSLSVCPGFYSMVSSFVQPAM
ncbi:hypothetical protein GH714_010335 [Hevea brasiliensis]|uniref:Topoisomerase 6 subunit A/Spo11 TOPRIM domain-containing protein n=1 Tax=Hevea brasiliensis TaxID=3981 RepID=A0A6A6N019_HEVBR|nr:hypothetical protein GH714_010335 [Hevea brasiliensis]